MEAVIHSFPVTTEEYNALEEQFGRYCHKMAWIFLRKNYNNNHTEEQPDIVQMLRISMIRAASYTKRQRYIQACFAALEVHIADNFLHKYLIAQLQHLWDNRKRHGANRQKFGPFQEAMLENLVMRYVPEEHRPDRFKTLDIDADFATYCKNVVANGVKSLGKKVTKEKTYRSGMVSISEFDYLAHDWGV